ncbi:MAG: FtsX-like permease family protein [Bacteroidota bacterium]
MICIPVNYSLFIARRILSGNEAGRFSRPIVRISVLGISLGLAVMILTMAVVTGFQNEIRDKVIGFGSHIQMSSYDNNDSYEFLPIEKEQPFLDDIRALEGVRHVQAFAVKAGIMKWKGQIHGVVMKGVDKDFDWSFFSKNMVDGKRFSVKDSGITNSIVISKYMAGRLKIKVGDSVQVFSIQHSGIASARKPVVSGIYETGMGQQFDEVFILTDIARIRKLNGWTDSQVAGFEVLVDDFSRLDELTEAVNGEIGYEYQARNIKDMNRPVFAWLGAQDINAIIVIALMVLVAGINMISALLILILERTNMIGILKALGSDDWSVRKVFLYNAVYLIGRGMLWGNIIAIGICLAQKRFGLMTLDPESYFLSRVPINLDVVHILLLNAGTIVICTLMLIIPSYIVTRITPVRAIRFS